MAAVLPDAAEKLALLSRGAGGEDAENAKDGYRVLDAALDEIGPGPFQHRLLALTAMGHFVEAVESSLLGILLPLLQTDFACSEGDLALVSSLGAVGMMAGSVFFGVLSNMGGRRLAYQISLLLCVLFGLLSSFAPSIGAFAALRLGLGFGYGGNLVASSTLLLEFCPKEVRGRYANLCGISFGVGAVFVAGLAWALVPVFGWRWLVRLAAILGVPVLIALPFIPESPRFYVLRQRPEDALAAVRRVAQVNEQPLPRGIVASRLVPAAAPPPWTAWGVFTPLARTWRTLVPLAAVWFVHAFAGSLFGFMPLELQKLDPSDSNVKFTVALVMASGALLGSLVLLASSQRFGRLQQLRAGLLVTVLMTCTLGQYPAKVVYAAGFFLAAAAVVPIAMLYLYTPEAFPTESRTIAFAFCLVFHRLAPICSPFAVTTLLETGGFEVACLVFGSLFGVALGITLLLRTETLGRAMVEAGDFDDCKLHG